MKLLLVLALCAVAAAAPELRTQKIDLFSNLEIPSDTTPEGRNILINALVRQLIAYIRRVINDGSSLFGIPPLDPLDLEHFHLEIPAGLINLDLELRNIFVTGFGGFVVHRSDLNIRELSFDIDISFPQLDIRADHYDLVGDLFTAIPLFGKGQARFFLENFRLRALLRLKQSEDGYSVLIDRIDNASFEIPSLSSELSGVIGGGDIDKIVNAIVEDVIIGYANRFQRAIAAVASQAIILVGNPILNQLNTWRFIAPFV